MIRAVGKGVLAGVAGAGWYHFYLAKKQRTISSKVKDNLGEASQAGKHPTTSTERKDVAQPKEEATVQAISIQQKIKESRDMSFDQMIEGGDFILLVDTEIFSQQFLEKVEKVLTEIKRESPNVRISCIKRSLIEEKQELSSALSDHTFAVFKKKGVEAESFTPMAFLAEKPSLFIYFTPLKQINSFSTISLAKDEFLLASCGGELSSTSQLESLRSFFPRGAFADYARCEDLGGTNADMFLVKRHSEMNSVDETALRLIDGRRLDVYKMENFFQSGKSKKLSEKAQQVATEMSRSVVFNPLVQDDFQWSVMLEFDFNSTPPKKRKEALSAMKDFYLGLNDSERKQVSLSYQHEKLKHPRLRVANRMKMRVFEMSQMAQDTKALHELEKRFPFLLSEKNRTWFYKYPLAHLTPDAIAAFFRECREDSVEDFHQSSQEKFWKVSSKRVFDDFGEMARDGKDHIVLLYKNNPGSTEAIDAFEGLCRERMQADSLPEVEFNRVNAGLNAFSESTPKLIFIKKGVPAAFPLSPPTISRKSIADLIDVMKSLKIQKEDMMSLLDSKFPLQTK